MRINKSLITYQPTSGAGSGTVTSVALSAPTGFTVSGSPITSSGTLSLAFASGYSLPTTIKQSNWDDAYTFVANFPSQTGNNGKFLYTSGSVLSWQPALQNPMSNYGEMIFGGTSGVPSVISPNFTTTKKYLQQVGDGTNPFAPSWGTLDSNDITGAAISTSNDTNILITASGNTTNALLRTLTLTTGWTGQLAVGRGGTGAATLTGVVIGNGTSNMTAVAGTAGQFLRRNTANTAYEFRTLQGGDIAGSELTKTDDTNVTLSLGGTPASSLLQPVSLNLGWSGQLAVGRGGTGASTLTGVLIGNGTSAVTGVTGTAGQLLRRNAANTAYEFFTASLITGSGVANFVPIWTSATNLLDSPLSFVSGEANFGAYKLVAGNASATDGSILLQDNYSLGHLANLCTNRSAGNPVLTYGLTTSTSTSNAFVSATSIAIQRGALSVSGDLVFRSAASSTTSIGTAITMTERFTITNGGQMVLPMYTSSSSMPGTAAGILAFNSIGSIITIAAPSVTSSGTYTPTWTGLANVGSVTAFSCQYMRVGDTVTVSGWVTIDAVADNTPTSLSFSLPINSNTTSVNYLNGTGVQQGGGAAASLSGYGANYGEFEVSPLVDTAINYSFHFTYRII